MIVILMGVSASGKTTVGRLLAEKTGWPYFDADDYHPLTNIDKMRKGIALDDADRWPWLDRLHALVQEWLDKKENAVLACSALTAAYRERLGKGPSIHWVYLKADRNLIHERLLRRTGHFMNPVLLESQFQTLEEPRDAIVLDARESPERLVEGLLSRLKA
jgi:gluconokinase